MNTQAAAETIIDRLGQDPFPRSSGSEAYYWRSSLIGFPDRIWLIDAMKQAIKRSDYPITQGFLENLATLQSLYHTARKRQPTDGKSFSVAEDKAKRNNWLMARDYVEQKHGRAKAMTVHSLLEDAWLSTRSRDPQIQRKMPRLVQLVPDIFSDLPELPQQYLLDDSYDSRFGEGEWNHIKSPCFVKPLARA